MVSRRPDPFNHWISWMVPALSAAWLFFLSYEEEIEDQISIIEPISTIRLFGN